MKQRLQKLIAASGLCSRRKAEAIIEEGRVRVNGKVARLGDSADPEVDDITADGKAISVRKKVYFLLNKPPGYECTLESPTGKPLATDLVRTDLRIFTVGRLDANSRGLIILTNDGDFANLVGHPSGGIEKEYHVTVKSPVPDDIVKRLASGVLLEGIRTAPCAVDVISRTKTVTTLRFILHEGRKRQVRRMLEVLGFKAIDLVRVRVGNITLDGLAEGRARPMTRAEIEGLRDIAGANGRVSSDI